MRSQPSKRMRAMLVCLLLLCVTLAGCSSSSTPADQKYRDADFRFAGQSTEAFEESTNLQLAQGQHLMRISATSQDGFGVGLACPPQREPYSGIMMPCQAAGLGFYGPVSIGDLWFHVGDQRGGNWQLAYGCQGPCSYAVALDNDTTMPEIPRLVPGPKQASASGTLTDDSDTFHFEVPRADNRTQIAIDFYAPEGISVRILDEEGNQAGRWNFVHGAYARGWVYESRNDDLRPGTWELRVGCDGTCEFDIGVR